MRFAFVLRTLLATLLTVAAARASETDKGNTLTGTAVAVDAPEFCISSDGCIWACRGDFGLERFDGQAWKTANTLQRTAQMAADDVQVRLTFYSLIPADNGWILAYAGHRTSDLHIQGGVLQEHLFHPAYMMLNGRTIIGSPQFGPWIATSRQRFIEAYTKPSLNRAWYTYFAKVARSNAGVVSIGDANLIRPAIVVDKQKNIWVTSFWTAAVFPKTGTVAVQIPPDPDVKLAGHAADFAYPGHRPSGSRQPVSVSLAGDGKYVLLVLEDRNTYFARLTPKGEIDFQKGPQLSGGPFAYEFPLRDPQGGLWLVTDAGLSAQPGSGPTPPPKPAVVHRVTGPDKGEDFNGVGLPRLVDTAGCVWLVPHLGSNDDTATIWAPGGKTSTLKIPKRENVDFIAAGEKGHVYMVTAEGLQEFAASDPDKPSEYSPRTLYHLAGIEGKMIQDMQYSGLGYLAVVGIDPQKPGSLLMHLFALGPTKIAPKSSESGKAGVYTEVKPAEPNPATSAKTKPPAVAAPAAAKPRTWQDASGKFSVEAEFVSALAGVVKLRKTDGSTISLPIEKLSDEDQQYIRKRGR